MNKIQVFVNRSLRRILEIWWYDKMSNVELWKATDQESSEVLLKRRRWTWMGHTLRKPRGNIARRALQWNPQGQRNRGRPKNTWRRGVEQEMREAGVTWVHWNQQHRIVQSGNSSLAAYAPHLERQRLKSSKSPLRANSLQSSWFWAISITSVSVRLWSLTSSGTVFNHVVWVEVSEVCRSPFLCKLHRKTWEIGWLMIAVFLCVHVVNKEWHGSGHQLYPPPHPHINLPIPTPSPLTLFPLPTPLAAIPSLPTPP